jgi:hypothetical protein
MRRQLLAAVLVALVFVPVGRAWTWPATGAVLQPFLFDPAHPYAAGQHRGIDVGGDLGATVHAPAAGNVTFTGTVPSSGNSVTIATADGYAVTLTHLGSITVARGAAVAEGAGVGTIGISTDPEVAQPYVHLGVRIAAEPQGYLDPLAFLPARAPVAESAAPPAVTAEPPAAPVPVVQPAPAPASSATPAAADSPAPVTPSASASETPAAASAAPVAATAQDAVPAQATGGITVAPTARSAAARPTRVKQRPAAIPASDPAPAADAQAATSVEPATSSGPRSGNEPAAHAAATAGVVAPRAFAHLAGVEPAAADARDRARARVARGTAVHAPVRSAGPAAAVAQRHEPQRPGAVPLVLALLTLVALVAAALLAGLLRAVRMMVRCGTNSEEDPGRPGLAVCSGPSSPWSRSLLRPERRVRAVSPAQGQRRPDGQRDGRARHAGDGGRRQRREVLR